MNTVTISRENKLQDVISHNPLLETVLARFDIKYTHANQTIDAICTRANIETEFFIEILNLFEDPSKFSGERFEHYSTEAILDYLKRTHRYYQNKRLYEIEQSVYNMAINYGAFNPLLRLLRDFFQSYKVELVRHIEVEELELFPYIRYLYALSKGEQGGGPSPVEYISLYPHHQLSYFQATHNDEVEKQLQMVRETILDYDPTLKLSLEFSVLLFQLASFEEDLRLHGLIEDEVLMPRALQWENIWMPFGARHTAS